MEGGNGLPTIKREQIVSMNQHYRRFSLDYYLECQEKLGVENIEFWLGASHFYVDSKGYEAIQPVRKKLQDHHIKVVSVTTPSCAFNIIHNICFIISHGFHHAGNSQCLSILCNAI